MRIVYTLLNGRLAGGRMICLQCMLAARAAGHDVCLVTPSIGEMTDRLTSESIAVVLLPMARTFHFHRALQFARFLKSWQADLVHCHSLGSGCVLARLGSMVAGVPIICHCHAHPNFSTRPFIRIAQVALDNFTARRTVALVAVAESVRAALLHQGVPPERIKVIHNGVTVEERLSGRLRDLARSALSLNGEGPVVGTVARLCPVKGQREFILAAQALRDQFPHAKFVIVGEDIEFGGRYRRELGDLIQGLGLQDHVVLAGFRPDAAAIMRAFDVFVLPSWVEGLPVTILEAMAAGRPVVATPVGGTAEVVVDGGTGLLVPPRDPRALAKAIIWMLQHPLEAKAMGESGRHRFEALFTQERMVESTETLYRRLLAEKGISQSAR